MGRFGHQLGPGPPLSLFIGLVAAACAVTFEDYPVYDESPGASSGGGKGGGSSNGGQPGGGPPVTGGVVGNGGAPATGGLGSTGGKAQGGSISTGGSTSTTGGEDGTGGSGIDCDCAPGSNSDTLLLQNFEDGSGGILPYDGRNGGFFTFVSVASTIDPPPDTDMAPECTGSAGNCFRLCARGQVAGGDFSVAAIAANLNSGAAYDLSAYSGISFQASVELSGVSRLEFHAATMATTDVQYGGSCAPSAGLDCSDHYAYIVTTSSASARYTIAFSQLAQGGWGVVAGWTPDQVIELHWQVGSNTDVAVTEPFTLCLDDVTLVR